MNNIKAHRSGVRGIDTLEGDRTPPFSPAIPSTSPMPQKTHMGCWVSDSCQNVDLCSSGFSCGSNGSGDTPPDLQNNIIGIIGSSILATAFGS